MVRGMLPQVVHALICSCLLRRRVTDPDADRFEIETLGLELLSPRLAALRGEPLHRQPVVRLLRVRAVERVKEVVAAAPADAWGVARLVTIANLSPFHLCHVFRELVGTSIYENVLRERLAQALNAVLDAGDDITTIALDAGFASHSHFTVRFRASSAAHPPRSGERRAPVRSPNFARS